MQEISGMSSIGLIHPASDPRHMFGEIKDEGYPRKEWRHHFFAIGGSASDLEAGADVGPRETFIRELNEELVLPKNTDKEDAHALDRLKQVTVERAAAWRDYFFEIPESCFAQFGVVRKRWREVASVYTVGLMDDEWMVLTRLQEKYRNISGESCSAIIELDQVLSGVVNVSWETAIILRDFWIDRGLPSAIHAPVIEGVIGSPIGNPRDTYLSYRDEYRILKG